ncbi:hypothetical protein IWT140_01735 [Secundilactobacillus pentosiphilus]|uniref:Uncharacterized protein n=1 Tax=Secundilactobacillus pentosiphilus TaxID=1714682 RepID=A0A1Z5IR47_9LACO|nr:hypothetical protein [Secundilactobacillus pentosiphilus]GAX04098.1 hypothetical protein IWT140_01735 [Secundilactobacillus pentosiphilus]
MRKTAWYCKDEKTFNELIQKLTDAGFKTNMGASPKTIHFNDGFKVIGHRCTDMIYSHGFGFAPLLMAGNYEKYKEDRVKYPDWYEDYEVMEFKHGDTVPNPW